MSRINYIIIFSVCLIIISMQNVLSAVPTINVSIGLSWNNGTNYTASTIKSFACKDFPATDTTVVYGNESDTWGRSWTISELNDTFFRARLTLTGKENPLLEATIDHIKIRIYYTLPYPIPIFVSPTPANASTMGSTLRINVTSTNSMQNCWLSYNGTGTWQNRTLTVGSNGTNCFGTLSGEDEGINTGTSFQFQVYANASGNINQTDRRQVTVSSTIPNIVLGVPINNSYYNFASSIIINTTITDLQSDLFDYFIYGSKDINSIYETPLKYEIDKGNGTYTYNLTALPIDKNSDRLVLLWHLDQRSAYGENATRVFDFSGKSNNGTIMNTTIDYSGKFGRAYYRNASGYINNSINISLPLTISGWAKFNVKSCSGLGNANVIYSDGNKLNTLLLQGSNCEEIWLYGNKTFPLITAIPIGFNYTNWNMFTTISNTSGLYLYLNGNLIGNDSTLFTNFLNGFDIGNMREYATSTNGLFDEFAVWNRSLSPTEIKNLYRLTNGTYYWNATAQDTSTQINKSETRQFTINSLCYYNTSISSSISTNIDCEGNDLTFFGGGTITVTGHIEDWNVLNILSPTLLKIEQGGSIWL